MLLRMMKLIIHLMMSLRNMQTKQRESTAYSNYNKSIFREKVAQSQNNI